MALVGCYWGTAHGKTLFACVLLLLSCQPLLAESTETETSESDLSEEQGYLGVRLGFLEVQHVDSGSLNLGFMFGHFFHPAFALEASLDYHTPEFDVAERETYALQASAYLDPFPSLAHLQPYVVGGVGYYLSRFEFEAFSNLDNERVGDGGSHVGFGIDFPLKGEHGGNEIQRLTLDVRYLFTEESASAEIESDGVLITFGFKARL